MAIHMITGTLDSVLFSRRDGHFLSPGIKITTCFKNCNLETDYKCLKVPS